MTSPVDKIENCFAASRPHVEGKFLFVGDEKFYVGGVTYGTFRPDENDFNFPPIETIEKDFALMQSFGINSVRTYTVPSIEILDCAQKYNLKVLVGLPWEQHITFLDDAKRVEDIKNRVREAVLSCRKHPAILAYTLGNEIPAPIVRWFGHKRIENFLKDLYRIGKAADPEGLFTYVNYPTTEYLNLSFTDFDCFNVYLESEEILEKYLARLHNLIGDRPLVMAEIGLDSRRNGEDAQAASLDWQIRTVFSSGCAGAFVFAWTDEWWRGGFEIEDWDFGLTRRDRIPKPALHAIAKAFRETPFSDDAPTPKISVVICSYNGSSTIRDTLDAMQKVKYPNFEVIVVNDGSKDSTADIVGKYPVKLINTPNRGLSSARNTGMQVAMGEIVAYIDDDAYPDEHWLQYLAHAFTHNNFGGVGGPNIPPPGNGLIADCVANAPGGPVHVLIDDRIAEHIPGCNMAFRKEALQSVGGCDPVYRAAGDDVDLCWRIQAAGYTIGFHPAAVVWHHRRNSVKMYWKQQKGYGKAEALLERKWTEKYNSLGHLSWSGRIYGNGLTQPLKFNNEKIFHGVWGKSLFQSIYQPAPNLFAMLPLMPEWYFIVAGLAILSIFGIFWQPLSPAIPLFFLSIFILFLQAAISAGNAVYPTPPKDFTEKFQRWAMTTFLHLIQPLARLYGRLMHGLTPWGTRGIGELETKYLLPKRHIFSLWSEEWKSAEDWLGMIEKSLLDLGVKAKSGGSFDRYDLETKVGMFAACRGLLTIEEHGGGKQLVKLRCVSHYSAFGKALLGLFATLALFGSLESSFFMAAVMLVFMLAICSAMLMDYGRAAKNFALAFAKTAQDLVEDKESSKKKSLTETESNTEIVFPPDKAAGKAASGNFYK